MSVCVWVILASLFLKRKKKGKFLSVQTPHLACDHFATSLPGRSYARSATIKQTHTHARANSHYLICVFPKTFPFAAASAYSMPQFPTPIPFCQINCYVTYFPFCTISLMLRYYCLNASDLLWGIQFQRNRSVQYILWDNPYCKL